MVGIARFAVEGFSPLRNFRKSAVLRERFQCRMGLETKTLDVKEQIYSNGTTTLIHDLKESLKNNSFVKLQISYQKNNRKKALNTWEDLNTVRGRFVKLKSDIKVQLQYSYSTNDKTFNYLPLEAAGVIDNLIGLPTTKKVTLVTMESRLDLTMNSKGGILKTTLPLSLSDESTIPPIDFNHDRQKQNLISINDPFLQALKVTTIEKESSTTKISLNGKLKLKSLPTLPSARPRAGMSDKYRQIQNFVEILDGLVSTSQLFMKENNDNNNKPTLKVVDMGSGLAYLTFAVHRHFSKRFDLHTIGIESRLNLVQQSEKVAQSLGKDFNQLSFLQNDIMDYITNTHPKEQNKIDILIALHACDIATDEAIFCGIQSNSEIIVTAPCCQKQIRKQIELHLKEKKNELSLGPLGDLLNFGIFREREAEMVTDTLRALLLEWAGYDTKIMEFVSSEHTAKNVMIAAVKRRQWMEDDQKKTVIEKKIIDLMQLFGITHHRLKDLLFQ